jgi:beta-lactamase regulating signal transducer with metallopeptidase domain
MSGGLQTLLANLGAGALLGYIALPLLQRIVAPRFVHQPASSHRALMWALSLASALMLVPSLRSLSPHATMIVTARVHALAPPIGAPVSAVNASLLAFDILCVLGAAWSLATALAAARACVSLVQLTLLVGRASPAPSAVVDAVARCRMRGTEKIQRVLVSDEASVPFAAIPWAPVLVLPVAFADTFDRQALELTIEHEVTHLDRGDLWTSALARLLCVLFPLNPVAVRIEDDIAFAREAAVDARVSTHDPHRYATLLLDVAALARFDQLPRPVSLDDTALKKRIAMLTDASRKRPISIVPLTITTALLAAAALAAPMPSRSFEAPVLGVDGPAGRGVGQAVMVLRGSDSWYTACEANSAGDRCATADFADGTCRTNAENDRLFCAPPPPSGGPGRPGPGGSAFHIVAPEAAYVACEAKNDGDGCTPPDFPDGICVTNPENNRLVCAPPPPPADGVTYHFRSEE